MGGFLDVAFPKPKRPTESKKMILNTMKEAKKVSKDLSKYDDRNFNKELKAKEKVVRKKKREAVEMKKAKEKEDEKERQRQFDIKVKLMRKRKREKKEADKAKLARNKKKVKKVKKEKREKKIPKIKIVNPKTGRMMFFLGPTHINLIKSGFIPLARKAKGMTASGIKVTTLINKNGEAMVTRANQPKGNNMIAPNQGRSPEPNRGRSTEPNRGRSTEPNRGRSPEPNRGRSPEPKKIKRKKPRPKATKGAFLKNESTFSLETVPKLNGKGNERSSVEEPVVTEQSVTEQVVNSGPAEERVNSGQIPKRVEMENKVGSVSSNNLGPSTKQEKISAPTKLVANKPTNRNLRIKQGERTTQTNRKVGGSENIPVSSGAGAGVGIGPIDYGGSSTGSKKSQKNELYDKALRDVYTALYKK